MSDSILSSSETSLRSSDSIDSYSKFNKLKPYEFEPTVSDNESTGGGVSSLTMQTKELRKQCWEFVLLWENEVSDEFLQCNFLHIWLYNMSFMHTEAGIWCSE